MIRRLVIVAFVVNTASRWLCGASVILCFGTAILGFFNVAQVLAGIALASLFVGVVAGTVSPPPDSGSNDFV